MWREHVMVIAKTVAGEVAVLERWSEGLAEVHERVAHRFRRVEERERVAPWPACSRGWSARQSAPACAGAPGSDDSLAINTYGSVLLHCLQPPSRRATCSAGSFSAAPVPVCCP